MPTKNAITVLIILQTWITVYATIKLENQSENQTDKNSITLLFKCSTGLTGPNCSQECPIGLYGVDCALNCSMHCNLKTCDRTYGNCTYGCEYGWDGMYCEQDILTPQELQEQAIVMFFQMIAGIMGFYLLQIAFIKYRSLNLGCCCCCKYCPCNRARRKKRKLRQMQEKNLRETNFMVELEPLQCDKKCSKKQIVHVV